MSQWDWLETKLYEWLDAREQGANLTIDELCPWNASPAGADRTQLQNAINRLHRTELVMGTGAPGTFAGPLEEERPVPDRVGRYRIDREIGAGGFGHVYLGIDEELQRPVAIKVPRFDRLSRLDVDSVRLEAQTLAQLDHPHIVNVYDIGQSDEFPCYIVSKFIDGGTLQDCLRSGEVSRDAAVAVIAKISDALHYMHKRGIVHRDVKPSNILIDAAGHPYLADFGLALIEAHWGKGPRRLGSLAYMSPEQAAGQGHLVDGRSDIYSLGAVLYEVLCGRPPIAARTGEVMLGLVVNHDPKPPRQIDDLIPAELERICLKALAKRPTERYSTAMDFGQELRRYLDTIKSVTVRPSTESLKASSSTGGGLMWRSGRYVLGVAATCAVIALVLMNRQDPATGRSSRKSTVLAKVSEIKSHLGYRNELANGIMGEIDATLNWNGHDLDEGPWRFRDLVTKLLNEYSEYLTSKDKAELEDAKSQLDVGWDKLRSEPIPASGKVRKEIKDRFTEGINEKGKLLTDAKASWHLVEAAVNRFCDTLTLYEKDECNWSEVEDAHKAVVAAFADRMHDPAHPPELMTLINEAVSLSEPTQDSQ